MTSGEKFSILRKRSDITEAVRSFFIEKGFLQVETPLLASHVIPEAHIEIFRTEQISLYKRYVNLLQFDIVFKKTLYLCAQL